MASLRPETEKTLNGPHPPQIEAGKIYLCENSVTSCLPTLLTTYICAIPKPGESQAKIKVVILRVFSLDEQSSPPLDVGMSLRPRSVMMNFL